MCRRDQHSHCQPLRPILEVTENAKSSTAIAQIERDIKYIDAAFEKMKSDITNNISDIDKQKKKTFVRYFNHTQITYWPLRWN
jgi:predicted nucleic acid-binding OB-fold protein